MNLSLIFLVLVSVTVIHAGPDDWADCSSLPSGVTLVDCPTPQPSQAMPSGSAGGPGGLPPFHYDLLDCCVRETYSGDGPKGYKFFGGHYELVIDSVALSAGAKLYIKNVRCKNNGACKQYVIDSSATFPLTLPMSSGYFKFSSEESFSVTFYTNNQPKTGCRCCASGWDQFEVSCYRKSTLKSGFHAVESNCNGLRTGAHLASIHSLAEHNFIQGKYTPEPNPGLWFGLHDIATGGQNPRPWEYTDGSPYTYKGKWQAGEPNNGGGQEDCGHLWTNAGYNWNDINCNAQLVGVCKYNIF